MLNVVRVYSQFNLLYLASCRYRPLFHTISSEKLFSLLTAQIQSHDGVTSKLSGSNEVDYGIPVGVHESNQSSSWSWVGEMSTKQWHCMQSVCMARTTSSNVETAVNAQSAST